MKIIQINSTLNSGSTGRIAEHIGRLAMSRGHESLVAYGRQARDSASRTFRIGNHVDVGLHGVESFLFDRHGLGSRGATKRLVRMLELEKPDAVGLHNLHGYYLNFEVLFDYLKSAAIPVVWTFHDCWAFTGHCSYFDRFDCRKWESECARCPMTSWYPRSLLDFSTRNFRLKKRHFRGVPSMTLVTPSHWLKGLVQRSFLSDYPVRVIHNGVDLNVFKPPVRRTGDGVVILGVASIWSDRKGLRDFIKLRELLPSNHHITLVGVTESQQRLLPQGMRGISRTESIEELVSLYQDAAIFVNPTYSDNFPTTNIEALACGIPIVTYDTGGSPEALDEATGRVVPKGDVNGLASAIADLTRTDPTEMALRCRGRAERLFNQADRFAEYVDLFESAQERHVRHA